MKNWLHLALIAFCLLLFDSFTLTSEAVRETSGNADMLIRRYERKGQFGKAALWRETAARSLDVISIPLAKTMMDYYERNNDTELVKKIEAMIAGFKSMQNAHLRRAKSNWAKAKESKKELDAERVKTEKFIAEWVPYHPNRFYLFDGCYPKVFKKPINALKTQGKYGEALFMEADSSDMRVRQYEEVTIKYFREKAKEEEKAGNKNAAQELLRQAEAYQKVRDKHLKRSALLRALAKQSPTHWPSEAAEEKVDIPPSKHKLKANEVIKLAGMDERVQQILRRSRKKVAKYAWFQGFGWTVSYYAGGCLGIAFVDDETAAVTDVLISP